MDPKFDPLKNDFEDKYDLDMNVASAQEHVPEIERAIRTIKERYRATYHRIPFNTMPKVMIKAAAFDIIKWLNMFPPKGGISTVYSLRAIVTRKPIDYNKHCKFSYGGYVQALQENNTTNTEAPRTIDAIFLQTLDNQQAGYLLMNLATGKTITRRKCWEISMTQNVVN